MCQRPVACQFRSSVIARVCAILATIAVIGFTLPLLAQSTSPSRQLIWPEEALRDGKIAGPPLTRAKRLYEDNFDNPESGFPRGAFGIGERDYEKGRYYMQFPGGPGLLVWNFPHAAFPNSALQVTGRVLGQGTDSWGVRINNYPFHWVTVSIKNNGELTVDSEDDVEPSRGPKIGPIKHPAIKTNDQFNTLLLVIRGKMMEIYVNDVAVCDPVVSDRDMSPTVYGLRMQRKDGATPDKPEIRVEFEQVIVWSSDGLKKPESRGAVVKKPSPDDPEPTDPVPADLGTGAPLFTGDMGDAKLVQERMTTSNGAKVSFGVEDKLYQILAKAPGRYTADISRLGKIANFSCLTYARQEKPAVGGWGLAFGSNPSGRFEVQLREDSGSRQFRVVFAKDGDDEVIPWTPCQFLRPMTQFNALRVETLGKNIRLFVNGKFVGEKEDSRLVQGSIQPLVFADQAPVDARFSFVHVWRLKPPAGGAKKD